METHHSKESLSFINALEHSIVVSLLAHEAQIGGKRKLHDAVICDCDVYQLQKV
jgi:hypothetical protein